MSSPIQPGKTTDFVIHAVLWDMDGTLMDSQSYWDDSFVRLCTERGGTVTEEMLRELTGVSKQRALEMIAETGATSSTADPATLQIFEQMALEVERNVATNPPFVPGAHEITSALAETGLAQAIVSASPRPIVESIAHALGDVFAVLVTGDDDVEGKPGPAPYATAMQRLGVTPDECVVVEDSPSGAASARSNNLHVVQIGERKHFPADPGLRVVASLAEITPHLLLWEER